VAVANTQNRRSRSRDGEGLLGILLTKWSIPLRPTPVRPVLFPLQARYPALWRASGRTISFCIKSRFGFWARRTVPPLLYFTRGTKTGRGAFLHIELLMEASRGISQGINTPARTTRDRSAVETQRDKRRGSQSHCEIMRNDHRVIEPVHCIERKTGQRPVDPVSVSVSVSDRGCHVSRGLYRVEKHAPRQNTISVRTIRYKRLPRCLWLNRLPTSSLSQRVDPAYRRRKRVVVLEHLAFGV
jgi:hypothetical protein